MSKSCFHRLSFSINIGQPPRDYMVSMNQPPSTTPADSTSKISPSSHFSIAEAEISIESVARYFGGRTGYKPNPKTADKIRCAIGAACDLVTPKVTHTVLPVASVIPGKQMILDNGLKLVVPDCFDDEDTRLVAASIGTLGEELEQKCRDLASSGKIYESTLFDSIGTSMLDLLSEKISDTVENMYKIDGLVRGERFAPGLDGYPLEHQQLLFEMTDSHSVGVSLNSSNIMLPTKSVSFFMVLTETAPKKHTKNKCNSCRMGDCQFRITV